MDKKVNIIVGLSLLILGLLFPLPHPRGYRVFLLFLAFSLLVMGGFQTFLVSFLSSLDQDSL